MKSAFEPKPAEVLDPGPPDRPHEYTEPGPESASHERPTVPRPTSGPAASAIAEARSGRPVHSRFLPPTFAGGPKRATIPPARVIPPMPLPQASQGTKLGIQPHEYPEPRPPIPEV